MQTTDRSRTALYVSSDDARRATREYAAAVGLRGSRSGWIYGPSGVVAQGWDAVWTRRRSAVLDHMTRRLTAFESFQQMLDTGPSYCPSIYPRTWRERFLADAYDVAMAARGDSRRAWRGSLA